MTQHHRILVCGAGSIGERHIRNLLALGYGDVAVFRRNEAPLRTLDAALPIYTDLERALADFAPTVAFITNPTAEHVSTAMKAARAGCHLFIEKPVSNTLDSLEALEAELAQQHSVAMVGYMLRFHPLLRQVKAWLEEGPGGTLGSPLSVRASWGEHVPDWHPWEDYRQSYSVRADLGGGPALTLSHELDILVWMFGRATEVIGMTQSNSPLETNCEHAVDILARMDSRVVANVHLDYYQCPPHRSWELVCTKGRVAFDYYAGTLLRWDGHVGDTPSALRPRRFEPEVLTVPEDFDRNQLFVEELCYFFSCLDAGEQPSPGIDEASESVRIALLATQAPS